MGHNWEHSPGRLSREPYRSGIGFEGRPAEEQVMWLHRIINKHVDSKLLDRHTKFRARFGCKVNRIVSTVCGSKRAGPGCK